MTDQQPAAAVPAHDDPHMGGPVVEGDVPRLRRGLGHLGQIGPNVPVPIAVQPGVAQAPVNQARAVQAKGPASAGGGIPGGGHLHQLAPAAVPAYGRALAAPEIVHLANQRQGGLHHSLPAGGEINRQLVQDGLHIGVGNSQVPVELGQGGPGRRVERPGPCSGSR